ncbi:MAG: Flagellar brake protein YcgR [Pelotomaculum sp. PtaU1.Bin035]|nr:MAG: Flagellar brake protein YcgR [Pelotomaculum sp. PtaU1.Bin035]
MNIIVQSARIEFKSTVLGRQFDNIPLFVLSKPDKYTRVQHRKFVRLPIMMDIFFAEMPEKDEEDPEKNKVPEFIKSCTLDISGGGARILTGKMYPEHTILLLKFFIPVKNKTEEIAVSGRVVRSSETNTVDATHVAIEFTDITSKQQDMIVHFILNASAKSKKLPR